jgi:hypothetical protein
MKVATEKVIGFETNPYKQTCRNILKDIIVSELGHQETITGVSLCGASAEFENQVVKALPNSFIYCVENNKQTAKIAAKNIPKQAKLVVENWDSMINDEDIETTPIDWMWADFCCNPTFANCRLVKEDLSSFGAKVYAVTFDLGCRGIKGGSNHAALNLLNNCNIIDFSRELLRIRSNKEKTVSLIKCIIRYLATKEKDWLLKNEYNYMPHTVIYYGGGKNKDNPCVPMLTMIYCLNDKYKITNQRWSWKREAGYEVTKFINLFDVKNNKNGKAKPTTNEGESKMKVKNVVKVINAVKGNMENKFNGKNPVMIIAGHKAWATRLKNAQNAQNAQNATTVTTTLTIQQKQSAAGRKAWETRRKNAMA